MLARSIHTLQPQRGERFELQRLPYLREIVRLCADSLPLTPSETAVILDDGHDGDVERIELVRTCGKEMTLDEVMYRMKVDLVGKNEFLEMTPIAGTAAVFQPTSEVSTLYYAIGPTVDSESIFLVIERKSVDRVSVNTSNGPICLWKFIDNLRVDEDSLNGLFEPLKLVEWRANIASAWPCARGLRVNFKDGVLGMVLPPSLVATLLDALVVSSGVDALFESYRVDGLPSRPWIADGDVTVKVEPPRVGVFNSVSLKIPLHPLSVNVPNGRMEMFLSVCGCAIQSHPSCLLCGRCASWTDDDERRATFVGHCNRAGGRCLNRIQLTVGKSMGGAWLDKRSCKLCIRSDPHAMSLVEVISSVIQFANDANAMRSNVSKLIEHVATLPPPAHVINDLPMTRGVTKLLVKDAHFQLYDKKKKASTITDKYGNKLSKSITKRYGWLFPKKSSATCC